MFLLLYKFYIVTRVFSRLIISLLKLTVKWNRSLLIWRKRSCILWRQKMTCIHLLTKTNWVCTPLLHSFFSIDTTIGTPSYLLIRLPMDLRYSTVERVVHTFQVFTSQDETRCYWETCFPTVFVLYCCTQLDWFLFS